MISTNIGAIEVEQVGGNSRGDMLRFEVGILRTDGNKSEMLVLREQKVVVWPFSDEGGSCVSIANKDIERLYTWMGGIHYGRDYSIDDWLWKAMVVGLIWIRRVSDTKATKM